MSMMTIDEWCEPCFERSLDTHTQLCCGCPDCWSNAEHAQEQTAACPCPSEALDVEEEHWQMHRDCDVEDGCACADCV